MKDNIVIWNKYMLYTKQIKRNPFLKGHKKIIEAKKIAAKEIGCGFVDGMNIEIDGKYYGGMYCDDLARIKQEYRFILDFNGREVEVYGTIVIINERDGLTEDDCIKIMGYLLKHFKGVEE